MRTWFFCSLRNSPDYWIIIGSFLEVISELINNFVCPEFLSSILSDDWDCFGSCRQIVDIFSRICFTAIITITTIFTYYYYSILLLLYQYYDYFYFYYYYFYIDIIIITYYLLLLYRYYYYYFYLIILLLMLWSISSKWLLLLYFFFSFSDVINSRLASESPAILELTRLLLGEYSSQSIENQQTNST